MIIDAHTHLGKIRYTSIIEGDADMIVNLADEAGINKLCASSTKALSYDLHEGNRDVIEATKRYPNRILGYVVANPRYGEEVVEEFERYVRVHGMIGLKMHSHSHMYEADDPIVYPLMEKATQLRVPVLFHADIREIRVLAERFPDVTILVAHMGSAAALLQPTGDWIGTIQVAKKHDNIILETSASTFDMGMIERAVEALGAERIVYGSDMPLLSPSAQLAKVKAADISDEDKRLILGENMARLLHLRTSSKEGSS